MSNIRLIRRNGYARQATLGVAAVQQPLATPRLGAEWWAQGWTEATAPIDEACRRLCRRWADAWSGVTDWPGDLKGVVFAETRLGDELPAELMAAVLSIPDKFATVGTPLVLRKVDDRGVPGVRVLGADGGPIGLVADPETDLLRLDTWMTHAAFWLLALSGTDAAAVARILRRELP
jgi:hypothetical protein